jgi:D-glycero-D-manno-heptose 1,7-bisphosphate phosphatase
MMQRAVFLDRDGVLNRVFLHDDGKTHPPQTPEELEILPGVHECCRLLSQAGFLLIAVTNQPDVSRGTQRQEVVEAINEKIRSQIPLNEMLVCFHDNHHHCDCRKPKPGMILDAATRHYIDLRGSFMIGDRWTDIEAGRRSGCKTILINAPASEASRSLPNYYAPSFTAATNWILQQTGITASSRISRNIPPLFEVGVKDPGVSGPLKKPD